MVAGIASVRAVVGCFSPEGRDGAFAKLLASTRWPGRVVLEAETSDPVVTAELEMINSRLRQPKKYGRTVIPLLLDGKPDQSLTSQLQRLVQSDFRDESFYDLSFVHEILPSIVWLKAQGK